MIEPEELAEDQHAKIEESLKVLLEKVPLGVALSRGDDLLYVNRAYLRLLRNGDCVRQPNALMLAEMTPQWRKIVEPNGQSGPPTLMNLGRHESTGQRVDGSIFQFQIELSHINLLDGIATIAFITNLTEANQMKAEIQALAPAQSNLDSAFHFLATDQPTHRNDSGNGMPRASNPAEALSPACSPESEGLNSARSESGPAGGPEAIVPWLEDIAHDFNNLLTLIQVNASTLLAENKLDKELAESAEQIYQAVDKAANLTSKLLNFGRREQG